jgi:hypothetical protein
VGIFDIITGGSGPSKAARLKTKITQKYGDPSGRQKALSQLGEMKIPEAVSALMARFTVAVEPGTTDADEKEHTFELIKAFGSTAVEPVMEFLKRSDAASSWAVKLLRSLLTGPDFVGRITEYLTQLGPTYMRDPEKKLVLIHSLEGIDDPRVAPALVPLLDDMADDVKIAAIKALAPRKHEPAREPMLKILADAETGKRVQQACVDALHESGFGVQGFREKVEGRLSDPYFLDKSGLIQKRG